MEPRLMFTLPPLSAAAAIVTTGDGDVLGELNAHDKRHMASTTKIMTALVAIEESEEGNSDGLSLNDTIDVGYYPGNTNLFDIGNGNFDFGDQATLEDMIYTTMLQSDNEAAQAVGEHIAIHQPNASFDEVSQNIPAGLTIMAEFADLMNSKAAALGMHNSSFRIPDGAQYVAEGLPGHGGHYSTAFDLALLARHAMANDTFADVVGTRTRVTQVNGDDVTVRNGNELIGDGEFAFPGAEGLKTGFTPVAGRCLVSQATILGRTVNAVVLGAPSADDRYEDTHALLTHGFEEAYGFIVDVDAFEVHTSVATYHVTDRHLHIETTNSEDVVVLDVGGDELRVEVNGVTEVFPVADLARVEVQLRGGGDQIELIGSEVPFELSIDGGSGSDVIYATAPIRLGAVTAHLAGELIEQHHGDLVATFTNMESVQPDDYGSTASAAAELTLTRGCDCEVDIEQSGFLGSVDDQDWFRFEASSGEVTMSLSNLGAANANPILQVWKLSSDTPLLVRSVSANIAAETFHITAGSFAFKVQDSGRITGYRINASVPAPALSSSDLIGIPTRPDYFWKYDADWGFGNQPPKPSPKIALTRIRDARMLTQRSPTRTTTRVSQPAQLDDRTTTKASVPSETIDLPPLQADAVFHEIGAEGMRQPTSRTTR